MVFSAVSTAILVLLYLTLGRATFKYEEKAKNELKERQARLEQAQQLVRSVPNPKKAIEEIEKKVEEFKAAGASKKQMPRLLQALGQASAEHGLNVINLKPREDIKVNSANLPEGVSKVFIEMVADTDYKSLADFIKAVGSLPAAFNLESLAIEKNQEPAAVSAGAEKKPLRASLLLSAYLVWEL